MVKGLKDKQRALEGTSPYVHYRVYRRKLPIFWLVVVALCLAVALGSFAVKTLFQSVGESRFLRYEPVDVPPADVSARHARERIEYERRAVKLEEESKKKTGGK